MSKDLKQKPLTNEKKDELIKQLRDFKLPFREDVIKNGAGGAIVDWEEIVEMGRTAREGTQSETLLYGTYDRLIELGVMSLNPKGNYALVGRSMILNPRSHGMTQMFFTRKEDADAYKKADCERALYAVEVFKLS